MVRDKEALSCRVAHGFHFHGFRGTSSNKVITAPLASRLERQTRDPHRNGFFFSTEDYLELVDRAGRAVREDKGGAIVPEIPPILARLHIDREFYLRHVKRGGRDRHIAGTIAETLYKWKKEVAVHGTQSVPGQGGYRSDKDAEIVRLKRELEWVTQRQTRPGRPGWPRVEEKQGICYVMQEH